MKKIIVYFGCLFFLVTANAASNSLGAVDVHTGKISLETRLSNPLLRQGLVNFRNADFINRFSVNYPKQNTINVGWLGVFRRYNSGETFQNRTALDTQRRLSQFIFDMDGDQPLDWSKVSLDGDGVANFSAGQYAMSLETSNLAKQNSPVLLLLLSNQHVINDYLSNPAQKELTKLGYTVAVLEYPNYGVSFGSACLDSWLSATRGAIKFLASTTGRKIFVVGHSIGGPLGIQAAVDDSVSMSVAGIVSYGGFTDIYDMARDNVANPILRFFAKPIAFLTLNSNIIDGIGNLATAARKKIPTLIMHGARDGAVPVSHFLAYQDEVFKIENSTQTKSGIQTLVFPDYYHEELNNLSSSNPEHFATVWSAIGKFIATSNKN